ncbi:YwqG family protein [Labrys neptuniae]|uniref:YwqG family protein n=1 Tax=Labrys neptuniae TaxID=376174 RepID=UPI00288E0682|nr:YwqG family protein [Labrys neptuniae]MDT3380621.1 YwqG family protein [Labrys neptuniae]
MMFDSPEDARLALQAYFDTPRIEMLVEALVPTLVFEVAPGKRIVVGDTKFGGRPDLPAGSAWPRPPAPADPEAIASQGNAEAGAEMRRHLAQGLPYTFIAQIDLAEAASLGNAASPLPPDGRLLFFYDLAVGPWETGKRPAKVIWDRAPRNKLATLAMPEDLARAAEKARRDAAENRAKYKLPEPSQAEGSNYEAPERGMTLRASLSLPDPSAIEMEASAKLNAAYSAAEGTQSGKNGQSFEEAYGEALTAGGKLKPAGRWHRQQLLGSPQPEQDDPRYDAVIVSQFGKQHLSSDEWKKERSAVMAAAHDWVLLFQLDLADWSAGAWGEGTVYFLMRRKDLEQRRFDEVVAVYQQT